MCFIIIWIKHASNIQYTKILRLTPLLGLAALEGWRRRFLDPIVSDGDSALRGSCSVARETSIHSLWFRGFSAYRILVTSHPSNAWWLWSSPCVILSVWSFLWNFDLHVHWRGDYSKVILHHSVSLGSGLCFHSALFSVWSRFFMWSDSSDVILRRDHSQSACFTSILTAPSPLVWSDLTTCSFCSVLLAFVVAEKLNCGHSYGVLVPIQINSYGWYQG